MLCIDEIESANDECAEAERDLSSVSEQLPMLISVRLAIIKQLADDEDYVEALQKYVKMPREMPPVLNPVIDQNKRMLAYNNVGEVSAHTISLGAVIRNVDRLHRRFPAREDNDDLIGDATRAAVIETIAVVQSVGKVRDAIERADDADESAAEDEVFVESLVSAGMSIDDLFQPSVPAARQLLRTAHDLKFEDDGLQALYERSVRRH